MSTRKPNKKEFLKLAEAQGKGHTGKVSWVGLVETIDAEGKGKIYSMDELWNVIGKDLVTQQRLNFKLNELARLDKIRKVVKVDGKTKTKYYMGMATYTGLLPPEEAEEPEAK